MEQKLGPDPGTDGPEIKIVDRRSFTSDGRRRETDSAPQQEPPPAPPDPPRGGGSRPAGAAPRPAGTDARVHGPGFTMDPSSETERSRAGRDAAFLNLCVSLYESGCIHLGISGPEGQPSGSAPDLDAARGAVEMLEMLKRKTHGNLSREEQEILDSLLAELQMAYVMKAPGA